MPDKGRHRSRQNPAQRELTEPCHHCRANRGASLPLVSGSREPLVKPQDSQLSDQRSPEEAPSASQETWLKTLLYFLWRVSKDEDSRYGIFQLVCIATIPLAVVTFLSMPAPSSLRAIFTGGTVTVIAVATSVLRWVRKRRSRRLTTVWGSPGPTGPKATAQEGHSGPAEHYRNDREHGRYARPHQDAHPARQRRRCPCTSRSGKNPRFNPVGNESQAIPVASGTICICSGVRLGQGGSGPAVNAHLVCPIAPAGSGMRSWRDSANAPSP